MTAGALLFRRTPATMPLVASLAALPSTYVHPGQVVVSDEAGVITTILGSCVAVCLHETTLRFGGMNHYLLPGSSVATAPAARYGVAAIRELYDAMLRMGARPSRMRAQLFGGAAVLAAFNTDSNHLGARNVTLARTLLADLGVSVIGEDVLGERGRKLTFSPRDGVAQVQMIGRSTSR